MQRQSRNGWEVSGWLKYLLAGSVLAALLFERRYPLRPSIEPRGRRQCRNLAMTLIGILTLRAFQTRLILPLSRHVEHAGPGRHLPAWLQLGLTLMLLDYSLYLWHVLLHKVPLLWRFHLVHHVDLDLDASTAQRFHAGELLLSGFWRVAQVWLLGVPPRILALWQGLVVLSVLFHHANVKLPLRFERWLSRWIVTPRMHGIHHSTVLAESNSNFSSGLTLWDWLHGTLRLNVPQSGIVIGVEAYQRSEELTLPRLLMLPFGRIRAALDSGINMQR